MAQYWLSVIIPTFNGEEYLSFALDSIAIQDRNDIECIIVDDGSTDSTFSIISKYQNQFGIKTLKRERQGNWVANTNYALTVANGEYACFLHQDDIWLKNRLNIMKQIIDEFSNVQFFLHATNFINVHGRHLGRWQCPLPSYPEIIKPEILMERLLIQNFIAIPAPIFSREIALKVGGLDETVWYTADWDFWLKIAKHSNTLYYPKPLSGFRIHPRSQTILRSSYIQDFREQLERVTKKHLALWEAPEDKKRKIYNIANFSVEINSALAATIHREKVSLVKLAAIFLALGPAGWRCYFQNSRIWERALARIKAGIVAKGGHNEN